MTSLSKIHLTKKYRSNLKEESDVPTATAPSSAYDDRSQANSHQTLTGAWGTETDRHDRREGRGDGPLRQGLRLLIEKGCAVVFYLLLIPAFFIATYYTLKSYIEQES